MAADPPGGAHPDAARERLARAQAELLHALVAGGPVPEGFDPVRVRVQAAVLVAKRRSVVARLFPDLAITLGDQYAARFGEYARARPKPGGARADGLAFARYLDERGLLPDHLRGLLTPSAPSLAWPYALAARLRRRRARK